MPSHAARLVLPYTTEQVFNLVSDIESYPRFIAHVAAARIVRRTGDTLLVEQSVRFKVLKFQFRTRAVFDPPRGIRIVSLDSPFGTFAETWTFDENPAGGTLLRCHTEYEFKSMIFRIAIDPILDEFLQTTMRAFDARARQLYGGAPAPPAGDVTARRRSSRG